MASTLLMLPPQTTTTREWATRLDAAVQGLSVVVSRRFLAGQPLRNVVDKSSWF